MVDTIAPELTLRANRTRQICGALAAELSRRAERKQFAERLLVGLSNIVGIASLIIAFFLPPIVLGQTNADKLMTAVSALVLIVVPYVQMGVFKDPPTRYQDFSFYIGGFADKIDEILSDVKSQRRYERLMEVLALADKNLTDVRVKWPTILVAVETEINRAQ